MNLELLQNKTILLLGKTRALEKDEFLSQLQHHNITCISEYSNEVSYIIEGRMLNPFEQEEMEELHKSDSAPFLHISALEEALCKQIDSTKLHMSLKLSSDEDRLLAFIKNEFITDELFLRLITLHDWKNENFFENNENRDVTAALILRFYTDIQKNHNVQYATTGLLHLILQSENSELIEVISSLQPIKKAIKDEDIENGTFKILQVISLHPLTPSSVIKMYIKNATKILKAQVCTREDLNKTFQNILYKENEEVVNYTLSQNSFLDIDIAKDMVLKGLYVENIAKLTRVDAELFDILVKTQSLLLAINPNLNSVMIKKLFSLEKREVLEALALNENLEEEDYKNLFNKEIYTFLAKNPKLSQQMLEELYKYECSFISLAENISTPRHILEELSLKDEEDILTALAKNISTPVDILSQLQLDRRYDRYVKENESFGKYITQDNIGWL